MVFFWLFQIASLWLFLISQYFFSLSSDLDTLILSLLLLVSIPVMIPMIALIRKDMTPMQPICTRAGILWCILMLAIVIGLFFWLNIPLWTCIYILIISLAIYFRIESRIFFLWALMWLIATISALFTENQTLAESMSIFVYLALVVGVFVEVLSHWFDRFHTHSRSVIHISQEFKTWYSRALSDYAWMATVGIQSIFIIALLGRGTLWNFDYQMLLYLAFGVWVFFAFYLFTSDNISHIWDFIRGRFSARYYRDTVKNNKESIKYYIPLTASILVSFVLIDWSTLWILPSATLIGFVIFIVAIVVSLQHIYSSFYHD